jgi:hypothetical protein
VIEFMREEEFKATASFQKCKIITFELRKDIYVPSQQEAKFPDFHN